MAASKKPVEFDEEGMVIIDGIPPLKEQKDYLNISGALEDAAKQVAMRYSKIHPVVYIPHEMKQTEYSEETVIDGVAFIHFGTAGDAKEFKTHFFKINETMERLSKVVTIYTAPEMKKLLATSDEFHKMPSDEFKESRNLLWWLTDPQYRDQFVVRFRGPEFDETQVFWCDENQVKSGRALCYDASELKEERSPLTNRHVYWSPNGQYLLSTHQQGVQLWGGPQFANLRKLKHGDIDHISFSPKETFLVTANAATPPRNRRDRGPPDDGESNAKVKIWDVLTGHLLRTVSAATVGPAMKLKLPGWWPVFRWSHDERYLAKLNSSKKMGAKPKDFDKINLFEMECVAPDADDRWQIKKLKGPSLTAKNLFSIEFSPADNILAYTTFATLDDQSMVTLLQIPSRASLKVQILGYDVKKAHLYWQSEGSFLAINMGHSGARSSWAVKDAAIGVISVKDRSMPYAKTESLGRVLHFAWEPAGARFAVIHNPGQKRDEPNVSVFRVNPTGKCKLILSLKKRRMNEIYWAPFGGRMVIVNVDPKRRAGGELEFVDVDKVRSNNDESSIVKDLLHETVTDISWDPSGRYLVTATTMRLDVQSSGDDTKYVVWSHQGQKLFEHKIKHFFQILWRPRPPEFERIENRERQIINHKLSVGWDHEFRSFDEKARAQLINKKVIENQKKLDLWTKRMHSIRRQSAQLLSARQKLRGSMPADSFTTKKVQQRLDKGTAEYQLSKELMRKLLDDENDVADFRRWRENNDV